MNPYLNLVRERFRFGTLDPRLLSWMTNEVGKSIRRARIPRDVRNILKVME